MRQLKLVGGVAALMLAGFAALPAAAVPAASSELNCQYSIPGDSSDSQQDIGTFVTSGSCSVTGGSGSLSSLPTLMLQVSADASGMPPINRAGVTAFGWIYYDFTVTGGVPGTPVPVLINTNMFTSGTPSNDANNAMASEAQITAYGLNGALQIVTRDGFIDACTDSPVPCDDPSSFSGNLSLTVNSGGTEELYLFVIAAASATQAGQAFASIDPYIYVDPSFAGADQYSITLSDGVGNGLPAPPPPGDDVPEPATWTMMLVGLFGLGAALRHARRGAVLQGR